MTLHFECVIRVLSIPVCLCLQYDFVELLDGSRLISKDKRALSDVDMPYAVHTASAHEDEGGSGARHTRSVNVHEAGFIQYLDMGIWHLAFYNDGRNTEQVSYNTIIIGENRTVYASQKIGFKWDICCLSHFKV